MLDVIHPLLLPKSMIAKLLWQAVQVALPSAGAPHLPAGGPVE
jgi:hypothetical protein